MDRLGDLTGGKTVLDGQARFANNRARALEQEMRAEDAARAAIHHNFREAICRPRRPEPIEVAGVEFAHADIGAGCAGLLFGHPGVSHLRVRKDSPGDHCVRDRLAFPGEQVAR